MPDFRFLSSASVLASHYSASVLPFPLSFRSCLTGGFPGAPVLLSLSRFFPSFRPGFPCLLSGSVYSAFCQFPFILPCFAPTAVPQVLAWLCSPFGSLHFSIFPFFSAFLSIASFPVPTTQLPFLLFPSSLSCLTVAFQVLVYPRSLPSVSILPFPLWYSAFLHFLSPLTVSRYSATSAAGLLFPARPFPLAFALGSGYLARVMHPQN